MKKNDFLIGGLSFTIIPSSNRKNKSNQVYNIRF